MAQASHAVAVTSEIDLMRRIWTTGLVMGGLFSPDFTPEIERE
jgi:hypothetical protein